MYCIREDNTMLILFTNKTFLDLRKSLPIFLFYSFSWSTGWFLLTLKYVDNGAFKLHNKRLHKLLKFHTPTQHDALCNANSTRIIIFYKHKMHGVYKGSCGGCDVDWFKWPTDVAFFHSKHHTWFTSCPQIPKKKKKGPAKERVTPYVCYSCSLPSEQMAMIVLTPIHGCIPGLVYSAGVCTPLGILTNAN